MKVGIVGLGVAGEHYHLPAFQLQRDVEIAALVDTDLSRARRIADAHNVRALYGSLAEALAHERLDVVAICTPPRFHFADASAALRSGCHVLLEKPMTETLEEAAGLVSVARETGKSLCVVHQHKFHPGIRRVRELMDDGVLGDFLQLDLSWLRSGDLDRMVVNSDWWVHSSPGGRFAEAFPHQAYIAHSLVGSMELMDVHAERSTSKWPWMLVDNVNVVLKPAAGWVNVRMSSTHKAKRGDVGVIHGTKRSAVFSFNRVNLRPLAITGAMPFLLDDLKASGRAVVRKGRGSRPIVSPLHLVVVEKFLHAIRTGTELPTPLDEAYHVMQLTSEFAARVQSRASAIEG